MSAFNPAALAMLHVIGQNQSDQGNDVSETLEHKLLQCRHTGKSLSL